MTDQLTAFPGLPPPRPRRGGDPRLSPLKSAIQKYVRRGETQKAVATAAEMLEVPGGQASLERRLLVITAEDVGWIWVPAVGEAISRGMPDLLQVVAALSSLPKQKEAYWLANTVWADRCEIPPLSVDSLLGEISSGDYRRALAIVLKADELERLRGPGGIAAALYRVAEGSPVGAEMVMRSVLKQFRGTAGELWAAAIIAAIDQPADAPKELPLVSFTVGDRPIPLDWYTQDGHTRIGGIGLGMVAKRNPIERDSLGELMFNYESIKMGPDELGARWRQEAFSMDVAQHGWETEERGGAMWEELYRPKVEDAIRWLQARWLEEGKYA